MKASRAVRSDVAATARELAARGWVANHDGNVTARDTSLFVATPTATAKRLVSESSVIELDSAGKVVGAGKVFGEIGLHMAVYQRRADVHAVVHAHPPYATALACSGNNLIDEPFIAEAVVSIGPRIPLVPYADPGPAAVAAVAPWCELVDAVLLGNHGVMAWGATLEQALLRLELVEHLAKIATLAAASGGVRRLPRETLTTLLTARSKAGIGHAADRALTTAATLMTSLSSVDSTKPVVACAPAPHSAVATIPLGSPGGNQLQLSDLIRQEIVNALRK